MTREEVLETAEKVRQAMEGIADAVSENIPDEFLDEYYEEIRVELFK